MICRKIRLAALSILAVEGEEEEMYSRENRLAKGGGGFNHV